MDRDKRSTGFRVVKGHSQRKLNESMTIVTESAESTVGIFHKHQGNRPLFMNYGIRKLSIPHGIVIFHDVCE